MSAVTELEFIFLLVLAVVFTAVFTYVGTVLSFLRGHDKELIVPDSEKEKHPPVVDQKKTRKRKVSTKKATKKKKA